jgi:hypothetical protein
MTFLEKGQKKRFKWKLTTFDDVFNGYAERDYRTLVHSILSDFGLPSTDFADGPWLAGGTLRRLREGQYFTGADFDIFFKSEDQRDDFRDDLLLCSPEIVFESENAVTYKLPYGRGHVIIQLIHQRYYNMPSDVIANFDITACQLVTNGVGLVHSVMALENIDEKLLRINPIVLGRESYSAVHTFRRMIKMGKDGYRMGPFHVKEFLQYTNKHPETLRMEESMSPEFDDNGNPCKQINLGNGGEGLPPHPPIPF